MVRFTSFKYVPSPLVLSRLRRAARAQRPQRNDHLFDGLYYGGFVLGLAVGISAFLIGCPWNSCIKPPAQANPAFVK